MTSYVETLHDFCRTYDFVTSIIESSLALWQEYPGMKIDIPLADPPHSVALYADGTWEVLSKSKVCLVNDAVILHIPTLDFFNLDNFMNHTGITEREYLMNVFDTAQETLIVEIIESLPHDAKDGFTTYCKATFEVIPVQNLWLVHLQHPKVEDTLVLGHFASSSEARQKTMVEIERIYTNARK
jgi:hypothetical protein